MPRVKRDPRGGSGRNQGRKRTDIRNLTTTPLELVFDEPVVAYADVTVHFCPNCGSAWWEPATVTYMLAHEQPEPDEHGYYFHVMAEATTEQAEHHIGDCPAA